MLTIAPIVTIDRKHKKALPNRKGFLSAGFHIFVKGGADSARPGE